MEHAMRNVTYGANRAGRDLDSNTFETCSLTTAVILEPGESVISERVLRECGAFVVSSLNYLMIRFDSGVGIRRPICEAYGRCIVSLWSLLLRAIGIC